MRDCSSIHTPFAKSCSWELRENKNTQFVITLEIQRFSTTTSKTTGPSLYFTWGIFHILSPSFSPIMKIANRIYYFNFMNVKNLYKILILYTVIYNNKPYVCAHDVVDSITFCWYFLHVRFCHPSFEVWVMVLD